MDYKKLLKRMLINEDGEVSLSKIGTVMLTIAGMILAVPTLELQNIVLPAVVLDIAKLIAFIGGGTTAIGFRDAINKKNK